MRPISTYDQSGRSSAGRMLAALASGAAVRMNEEAVRTAYRRWAPVYDWTFGAVSNTGRRHAVDVINQGSGRVLEVGVGTGLSLPSYARHLEIVGVDIAPEMLEKARGRVAAHNLDHVAGLYEMDAGSLQFPDGSFDTVVAMYVITVVPDPEQVMRELARVVKPGGQVLLVNHFSQEEGVRGFLERRMAPFSALLGWHPVFELARVTGTERLQLSDRRQLRPFGLFTMLRFVKS